MAPVVFSKDYEKLKLLGLLPGNFLATVEIDGQTIQVLQQKPDSTICVFFDEQKKACSIYDYRPFDCRMYPFDILQVENRLFWVVYHCNPESCWTWQEEHLLALEKDPNFEELLANMTLHQSYVPPETPFTVLREVNAPTH